MQWIFVAVKHSQLPFAASWC